MNIPYNQATQLGLTPPPVFPALPAPPAQLALPAPPATERALTLENFIQVMNLIREKQQGPPVSWGREMVDDEDYGPIIESVPLSPVTSFSQRSLPPTPMRRERERLPSQAPASEQDNNLNQSIAEVYGVKADDPEMPAVKEEVKKILTLTAARQQGTRHGKRNQPPRGDYKDMAEYQENYNKAKQSLLPTIIPGAGKTRQQKKELSKAKVISTTPEVRKFGTKNPINSDPAKLLFSKKELDEMNEQAKKLNEQLAFMDNWNAEEELARANPQSIIMTNEDAEEQANKLLFGN